MKILALSLTIFTFCTFASGHTLVNRDGRRVVNSRQQTKRRVNVLPRIGTIKDYAATGLMTGCANYYFVLRKTDHDYVFLARSEGEDAWMNLDGGDVRLKQIKSVRRHNQTGQQFNYSLGGLLISVVIKDIAHKNGDFGDDDYMFEMKITLKQGRAVRSIKAVGYADC